MKYLVLFSCVVLFCNGLSDEFKENLYEQLEKIGGECMKETGANEDDIGELMAHKLPSRQEGRCMIFCGYKHFNMMHDDGTLNKEGAFEAIAPLKVDDSVLYEKVVAVGEKCSKSVPFDKDPCVYATNMAQCCSKEGKALGIDESLLQ